MWAIPCIYGLCSPSHAAQHAHTAPGPGENFLGQAGSLVPWHICCPAFWGGHQPGGGCTVQREAPASFPFGHHAPQEFIYLPAALLLSRAQGFSVQPDESSHPQWQHFLWEERQVLHLIFPGFPPPGITDFHQTTADVAELH